MQAGEAGVLVTGGAVRIGRAIVERFAAGGAPVVIHFRRSRDAAATLAAQLGGPGRAWTVQSDLADEAQCDGLIQEAVRLCPQLGVLVNNAAVFERHALADATQARLEEALHANLLAPVLLTRAFAARVARGVVVNLLDRRVAAHPPGCLPYLLAKKGLAEFTQVAAVELAPRIRVNGVAPGPVLPPPGRDAAYLRERAGRIPLECEPGVDDVAGAVEYLARAGAVTGQILYVDGGQHLLGNGV